ncbi:MAG: hydroxymethylglutaryl-CoA lyase [Planctomycetota bacterium]|nr:hydroxymethylglutaryl-CoA lyase [Planctomycetota bacterium]
MSDRVRITDVSPRDGLQNEPGVIPATDKASLVRAVVASGVDEVEVSSFVSARWVPQLGDAEEVFGLLAADPPHRCVFSALVPNERGLDAALAVNARCGRALIGKVAVFTAASETFSRRNTNASIAETLDRFAPVITRAHAAGVRVRGYVSCVVACPFEGPIAPDAVARVVARLRALGVDEIDLGDTIGAGTPQTIAEVLDAVRPAWGDFVPADALAPHGAPAGAGYCTLHLHDTFGQAAACVRAALDRGVRSFDGSVAGLGGCPYASTPHRRAPGNIDTQVLVRTLRERGFSTDVGDAALAHAAAVARDLVARARTETPP